MKSASVALIALLDSQEFSVADLYTFTLADDSGLYYTSADGNIGFGGHSFVAVGPLLSRGPTRTQIGVEVDTLSVTFGTNVSTLLNTLPVAQFAQQGGFDGARLRLERAFMPLSNYGDTSAGTLINFVGRVADAECTRSEVKLTVNSDLELLNISLPRNLYQAGCIHSLYDSGCGLSSGAFTVAGNTTANSTASSINCNLTQNAAHFDLGTISYTTGVNAGLTRSIKSYTVGNIVPSLPFPSAPAVSDLFDTKPGCDKLAATCTVKFANLANFRGYPTIPVPETSY